jgi:hypothetical protein
MDFADAVCKKYDIMYCIVKTKMIMKKLLVLLLILPLLLLLTGCPYYSKVPLSATPKTSIDTTLLGIWKVAIETPENKSSEMRIIAFNKMEYLIEVIDVSPEKTERYNCRAFITPVGGKNILNFEELRNKGTYLFFSYNMKNNVLNLEMVSDVGMKGTYATSKNLWKAFSKKINDSTFFESGQQFVRKTESF